MTSSPIYGNRDHQGRQIEDVRRLKETMAAGFAGIENELFYAPRTWMLFGDAKQSLHKLIKKVTQA